MSQRRVAIVGIWIEAGSFSGRKTGPDDFVRLAGRHLLEARYPFLLDGALAAGTDVEWLPLLHARALPGGPIRAAAYEDLEDEVISLLRAHAPLDAVVLDVHGAMLVEGRADAEAALARRVRETVGDQALIAVVQDLHGNTTPALIGEVDLITCFRTAPHEDEPETRLRCCQQVRHCLYGDVWPWRAWARVPLLVTGERSSTRDEPAKSLYALAAHWAGQSGLVDASIWMGYPWQDEARSAVTVVATGTGPDAVTGAARSLAAACWQARSSFGFGTSAASAFECIRAARLSGKRPFLISDTGDNPTAGGRGDGTYFLSRLLAHPDLADGRSTVVCAGIADAGAVSRCLGAGLGRRVTLHLQPPTPGDGPFELCGDVVSTLPGDAVGGDEAVVATNGVHCVLTSRRKPFHRVSDFTALGLSPAETDLMVVKIGYLEPELHAIAAGHMLALTPGAVDQDLHRLDYRHLARPIYPLDTYFASGPSLEPTLFAPRRGGVPATGATWAHQP
jgi:microcystin degradation protein MlrC